MKQAPEPPPAPAEPEATPFEKFDRLFRTVVSVPKSEVEKEEAKERMRNQKQRERKRAVKKKT